MIEQDAHATARLLPGEPDRRDLRRVEIDDPTLGVLIRITLDTSAVPPQTESVTLLPRPAPSSRRAPVWPEVPLGPYVDLAVAAVTDEGQAGDPNEMPAPVGPTASISAPRRHGAVNAARHRPDDLGAPVDLNRVAAVYRAARESTDRSRRRAPVAAVARDLGVHRTDAAWYVREARAVGVLAPAPPGDRYRG